MRIMACRIAVNAVKAAVNHAQVCTVAILRLETFRQKGFRHTGTHTHTRTHTHTHAYIYIYIYIYAYVCVCVCLCICSVCRHVCMYVYICEFHYHRAFGLKLQSFCIFWCKDIRHCMIRLRHVHRQTHVHVLVNPASLRDHDLHQWVCFMGCTSEARSRSRQLLLAKSVPFSKILPYKCLRLTPLVRVIWKSIASGFLINLAASSS